MTLGLGGLWDEKEQMGSKEASTFLMGFVYVTNCYDFLLGVLCINCYCQFQMDFRVESSHYDPLIQKVFTVNDPSPCKMYV